MRWETCGAFCHFDAVSDDRVPVWHEDLSSSML